MYTGKTMAEAVRKWQHDALPHISAIARELGVPFELDNIKWEESGHKVGYYNKKGARDTVEFKPSSTLKIRRKMGESRPRGKQENELAVVDDVGPNDYDTTETLSWTRGKSMELSETESQTQGWSVTVTQGFEVGGEASGVKYIAGLEIGNSGENSKEKAENNSDSWESTHSTEVDLPAGEIARLIQTVRTGEMEIDVEDFIVLDMGWRIADWKERKNEYLKNHSGWAKKGDTKSRWLWECTDVNDFRTMLEGTNPRYPGLKLDKLDKATYGMDKNQETCCLANERR